MKFSLKKVVLFLPRPLRRWVCWLLNPRAERYREADPRRWSILLWICGWLFYVLRRLDLHENLKHVIGYLNPLLRTPAWTTDLYLIVSALVLSGVTYFARNQPECVTGKIFVLWWAVQILQTNLYHNIWRQMVFPERHSMGRTYSHIRNCLIGICNFAALCWLFGLAYWWSERSAFPEIDSVWDAVYLSYVTGATLGYGDILPNLQNGSAQFLVVLQVMMSVCMLAVILAQAVSAVGFMKSLDKQS